MNLYSGRGKHRPYIMHEEMHFVGEGLDPPENHKIFPTLSTSWAAL
ncbi:MAG: hypothetical protein NC203_02425 [Firmicutes bacterium]|nr:hypothetical protein [[Eubacterium] siraeum]MCM1487199.1 hypothetical protein [Bacillota bacterium]